MFEENVVVIVDILIIRPLLKVNDDLRSLLLIFVLRPIHPLWDIMSLSFPPTAVLSIVR